MQKIIPHLWYDTQAQDAVQLYTSVFDDSKITHSSVIHDTPSGDAGIFNFVLAGQEFMAINAGPYFKFTPAVSFMVMCSTKEEVDQKWKKLAEGGQELMPLGEYPFSKWFGWTNDRFGLSWQIMLTDQPITQKIVPMLMFVGEQNGKASEAIHFYTSIFKHAKIGDMMKREQNEEPDKKGSVKYARFTLENLEFAAMDSAYDHQFTFNEAVSFIVKCENQEEIDYFWEKLSADPKAEQCGWLKDKYTLSWQVTPTDMDTMMVEGTPEQIDRVTQAFLKMKKFDVQKLKEAYKG